MADKVKIGTMWIAGPPARGTPEARPSSRCRARRSRRRRRSGPGPTWRTGAG